MNTSFMYLVLSGVTAALSTLGFFLGDISGCGYSLECYNLIFRVGQSIFYGGAALAIVFLILFAYPKGVPAWKKFAVWFIPLATLLFIFYPNPGSGDFLSPMPEQLFQWVSVLYVAVSAILIKLNTRK